MVYQSIRRGTEGLSSLIYIHLSRQEFILQSLSNIPPLPRFSHLTPYFTPYLIQPSFIGIPFKLFYCPESPSFPVSFLEMKLFITIVPIVYA